MRPNEDRGLRGHRLPCDRVRLVVWCFSRTHCARGPHGPRWKPILGKLGRVTSPACSDHCASLRSVGLGGQVEGAVATVAD